MIINLSISREVRTFVDFSVIYFRIFWSLFISVLTFAPIRVPAVVVVALRRPLGAAPRLAGEAAQLHKL